MAIRSAMCLSEGSGRITRRNVIEDSADAFPCMLRARNEVRKYAGDRKTKRLRPKDEAQMAAHLFLLKRKTPNQEEI